MQSEDPASAQSRACRGSRITVLPPDRLPGPGLCAALGSGAEEPAGIRAPRGTASAASSSGVCRQGSHTLEAERKERRESERASERERKPPGHSGGTRAQTPLGAKPEDCQLSPSLGILDRNLP